MVAAQDGAEEGIVSQGGTGASGMLKRRVA